MVHDSAVIVQIRIGSIPDGAVMVRDGATSSLLSRWYQHLQGGATNDTDSAVMVR